MVFIFLAVSTIAAAVSAYYAYSTVTMPSAVETKYNIKSTTEEPLLKIEEKPKEKEANKSPKTEAVRIIESDST